MAKRKATDWRKLAKQATDVITKEQNASYAFLKEKLSIANNTVTQLLKRLEAKGLVRRDKSRSWVVLVDSNGKPKPADAIPEKRRFKKIKRKKAVSKKTQAPARASAPAKMALTKVARAVEAATPVTNQKIELVRALKMGASGVPATLLGEIVSDLEFLERHRTLLTLLGGK